MHDLFIINVEDVLYSVEKDWALCRYKGPDGLLPYCSINLLDGTVSTLREHGTAINVGKFFLCDIEKPTFYI